MDDKRDPGLPGRLLAAERDVLIPWLRGVPEERFTARTAGPAWDVRQVLAPCSGARDRIVGGRGGGAEPLVLGAGGDRAGEGGGGRPEAQLATDVETLVRLYTGRSAAAERYELVGAAPEELLIYR